MEIFTSTETIVCRRLLIFQFINNFRSTNLSLKFQKFVVEIGCKISGF